MRNLGVNTGPWPNHYCGHSCSCSHKWPGALLCANMSSTLERLLACQCEDLCCEMRRAKRTVDAHRQNRLWDDFAEHRKCYCEEPGIELNPREPLEVTVPWAFGSHTAQCRQNHDSRPSRFCLFEGSGLRSGQTRLRHLRHFCATKHQARRGIWE